ncbi:MAG: MoxR family ATPase [Chloroflexi bacterium]|nr:MoxR family ATPase [Chloroflexota bacterium]
MLDIPTVSSISSQLLDELERVIIGKRQVLNLILTAILADGHVLLEDYPGLAKTLTAASFAQVLGLNFKRIQFTPDLLPADVTGSSIYNQRTQDFDFRYGPVFTNILLADEINRAPPKTQAALLEAMQEHQVTADGTTRPLPAPFLVLATQNPIEYEGTYPLPEAQLDRFLMRLSIGYPSRIEEWEMLQRRMDRRQDSIQLKQTVDASTLIAMQRALEQVHVSESISYYIVDLVEATRRNPRVQVGGSPRGTLAILKLARGQAVLHGRDYVIPEDVKGIAVPALAHRIMLTPEQWVQRTPQRTVIEQCLAEVPTPPTVEPAPVR